MPERGTGILGGMAELVPTLLAVGLGTAIVVVVASRYRDDETWWLIGSWFAHLAGAAAQFYLLANVYRGDATAYWSRGLMLGDLVNWDAFHMLRIALALILQQTGSLPYDLHGAGAPTGSMTGVAVLLMIFTGRLLYAPVVLLCIGACLGKIALYRAFRDVFPRRQHFALLLCTLYVPTVLFWSSSLLKESVVMVALGPFVLALQRVLDRQIRFLPLLVASALLVGLLKPYILLALILASGVLVYATRAVSKDGDLHIRPIWFAVAAAGVIAGLVLVGQQFPELAGDDLLDSITHEQATFRGRGGSAIQVLDPTKMGAAGQLLVAPLALFNAWFRPSLLDAHNLQALLNACETTLLMVLGIRAAWLKPPRELFRIVTSRPLLMFSLTFAFTLGIGVGLTTSNLGSLSRYRMPLMPFLAALIVLTSSTDRATRTLMRDRG